jgi:heme O synthase-like polyprenyltransferase
MEPQNNAPLPVELSSQLITIMTTEHYNLQMGRSMSISETNGRASLFVGAVSSGLVALAFVGQLSHLGTAFFVFSLVVLPTLFLMGLITFERVRQSGSADVIYARGINRIRHLYLEYAPQMQPYFILSAHDDREGMFGQEAMRTSWVQGFLSIASMIAIINSVLIGSFVGLLLAAFTFPLWVCSSVGGVVFLGSVALHERYQSEQWTRMERTLPVLFPSQPR